LKPRVYVDTPLRRWAYAPVMAVMVAGIVMFWWPWTAWNDYWLRRACRRQWGKAQGWVVIGFEPGTAWHEAVIAHWIPRYGGRTHLVDLAKLGTHARSLEDRVYERWKGQPPVMITIPTRGRVCAVSFTAVLGDSAALERRFAEVARLAYGEA
jgi:hypothetical protein